VTKTCLYRHYDAKGVLLYVGIASHFAWRCQTHETRSHWFDRVVRVDVEHHPNRPRALRAEAIAIRDENPRCNRAKPDVIDLKLIEEWEAEAEFLGLD
jgi:hypothetical protein